MHKLSKAEAAQLVEELCAKGGPPSTQTVDATLFVHSVHGCTNTTAGSSRSVAGSSSNAASSTVAPDAGGGELLDSREPVPPDMYPESLTPGTYCPNQTRRAPQRLPPSARWPMPRRTSAAGRRRRRA